MARRCIHKRRFHDKKGALRALHRIQNADKRDKTPRRVYYCDSCRGGWHMTSKPDPGDRYNEIREGVEHAVI